MRVARAALAAILLFFATPAFADGPREAILGVPGVRVWFHSASGEGKLYLEEKRDGETHWVGVCSSACRVVLPRGARVRATMDDDSEPRDFELQETGRDIEIELQPSSRAPVAGGIVMASIGGLTTLIGVIVFATAYGDSSESSQSLRTGGLVTTLIGGGLTIGGVLLMNARSKQPRIEQRRAEAPLPKLAEERVFPPAREVACWGFSF